MTGVTTPSVVNLLLSSIAETRTTESGEVIKDIDTEFLKYRLFNIEADNFGAFLMAAKDCLTWADAAVDYFTPDVAAAVSRDMRAIVRNHIISLTGKSSEHGILMKSLLQDRTESLITVKGGDKRGLMDRFRNMQGDQDAANQPPAQQPPPQERGLM